MPERVSVEIHHDYAVLEERLAAIVDGVKTRSGRLAPVAIVVPTQRLIAHLQVGLAERAGALAAVRFFHHDGLARAIAGAAGVTLPRALGDGAREAIVADVAARAGDDLAAWMAARPGGAAALRATFDDLREAGIDPKAALDRAEGPPGGLSAGGRQILALFERYVALLRRLEPAGFSDRCGRVARVLPHAAAFAARFDTIVHYGAYELTGVNLDLLRGLATAGRPLICLAPGHPDAPAFAYARGFWRRHLGVEPLTVRSGAPAHTRLLGGRLPQLYEEEARPGPAAGAFAFGHAQGPAAEIGAAVRGLLRDRSAGDDVTAPRPAGLALVARTLEPYALHLGPVFATHGIPFQSSAGLPATRQPAVQAAVWLLRCLADDFPAAVLCDLLRTGRVRPPGAGMRRVEPPSPDRAERLLRDWQIAGGRALIADRLPGWVEGEPITAGEAAGPAERAEASRAAAARRGEARRLAELVRRLARAGEPPAAARTWSAWAAACADLLKESLDGFGPTDPPAPGADLVLEALSDMQALDAAGLRLTPGAGVAALTRAMERATIPIGSVAADGTRAPGDGGGVRVLDAMQARGLSFDTVVLIGMNADLFPRRPREDPFLPDDDRRRLREAQHRPLPLASETRHEEHLLLAHLLGAARRRLVVLWQRADDEGKARSPSLALREIARLVLGAPDLEALDRGAARVSADPAARLRAAIDEDGLIARSEAGLAAAFACRSPGSLRTALAAAGAASTPGDGADADAAVPPGLAFLESIDGAVPTPFDALPGAPGDEPAIWSPSRLETLGGCPQQFFFRHVLHVDEWEAPPEAHESDAREMGLLAHEVLRDLYAALFPPASAADAGAGRAAAAFPTGGRVGALLEEIWRRRGAPVAARMQASYPGLWDLMSAQWLAALAEFVARDAADLAAALAPPRLEHAAEATIPLGGGQGDLRLRGRFDRLLRFADRLVVSDYKTGGRPASFVEPAPILKGMRLQMPLYILLAEHAEGGGAPGAVHAEVKGVGPAFAREPPEDRSARLEPDRFAAWRAGFLETLAVLRDLARAGLYPLDAEPARCGRCPYARACRRHHAPTVDRLQAHPALARFHATRAKSSRAPTLAGVAGRAAGGAP